MYIDPEDGSLATEVIEAKGKDLLYSSLGDAVFMNATGFLYFTALHNSDEEADIYILNGTTLEVFKGSSHSLKKA